MPTVVSLFTGCGGFDKGLIDAGYHVVMANDIMPYAQTVYEANLPETDYRIGNIAKIDKFPQADLLAGGYPCQGYSQGGARVANRSINTLYEEFGRALRIVRSKAFVAENVSGLARSTNRYHFNRQLRNFEAAGYTIAPPQIINGAEYGLPQERHRIFIVGIRSDLGIEYQFPQPTHGAQPVEIQENLMNGQQMLSLASNASDPQLVPVATQYDCLWETNHTWPDGEFCDQPFHWYYLSRDRYKSWDKPSLTILASPRHMPLHPMSPQLVKVRKDQWEFDGNATDARRLSYKEAATLQDMNGWIFPETSNLTNKYRVIGNAVPPMLARQIVGALPHQIFDI